MRIVRSTKYSNKPVQKIEFAIINGITDRWNFFDRNIIEVLLILRLEISHFTSREQNFLFFYFFYYNISNDLVVEFSNDTSSYYRSFCFYYTRVFSRQIVLRFSFCLCANYYFTIRPTFFFFSSCQIFFFFVVLVSSMKGNNS